MAISKDEVASFSVMIEKLAKEKSLSYMDSVIYYCEQTGYEIEVAAKLLSSQIKARIKTEAESLRFLKKSNDDARLPL